MSSDDIDLQYSHNFIYSISCLHIPTFRSQAATVSGNGKIHYFYFSHTKACVTKFDLVVKLVKVDQGSPFIKTLYSLSPRCCMPSFKIIEPPVLEIICTIYGYGGHLGHVAWTIYTNFAPPPFPKRLHIKFCFNRLSVFREDV